MALFSRRKKDDAVETEPEVAAPEAPAAADDVTDAAHAAETDTSAEPVPDVKISMSAYGGLGAPATPLAPGTATGADTQTAPGQASPVAQPAVPNASTASGTAEAPAPAASAPQQMPANALLAEALQSLGENPPAPHILNVARQLLQGHVYLRVQGDARTLIAERKNLPLAVVKAGDRQLLVTYSSAEAIKKSLEIDKAVDTSILAQPTKAVIQFALDGPYDGIVIDQASAPARAVLPKELLQRMMGEADPELRIKALLSVPRTPETPRAVAEAIAAAPVWVGVAQVPTGEGEEKRVGITESRTSDGQRFLELFSHPLEVLALARGHQSMPFTHQQLRSTLRDNPGIDGVVIDPGGPWLRIDSATMLAALDAAVPDEEG